MKYIYTISLSFLISLFTFSLSAQNGDFPEPMRPPRLVNDFARLLSSGEQRALEDTLLNYNNSSSIEIAIVTINRLGAYDVSDYAIQLANKWGIGKKDKRNGVLILVSKEDKKMFIATGYGMEGVLTDALSGRIVRNEMAPEFRNGDFYQGLLNAVQAIIAVSKNEYTAEPESIQHGEGPGIGVLIFVVIFFVIIFIIAIKNRNNRGGGGTYMSRRGADIITGSILGDLLRGGSGGGFGGGWGGGSSGGGFGGFGGGSFGGGGAGGSW